MSRILETLILSLCTGAAVQAAEAVCSQTQPVFYAGLEKQPLLRVRIADGQAGKLDKLVFDFEGTSDLKSIGNVTLYCSGSTPYFSLNAPDHYRAKPVGMKLVKKGGREIAFDGKQDLPASGDAYYWLVVDMKKSAPGNALVDAACKNVTVNGQQVRIENPSPAGAAKVFPFKYRIVPYFRCSNLVDWFPDLLQPEHFKLMTDIIYFNVSVDQEGNIVGGEDPKFLQGLEKLKKLRGKRPVSIILGIAHTSPGLKATSASLDKRMKLAKALGEYVKKHGFDGVDFDWEYPDNDEDWQNFAWLLCEVKPVLFEHGCSVTAAFTPYYKMASPSVLDQLDWGNTMSYDKGGEHSTMQAMLDDINTCRKAGMPDCKIVAGVPFYSNEVENRNWDEQKGYSYIVSSFPRMKASENTFVDPKSKKKHYFNGPDLIKQKGQEIIRQKIGGVMIWGYDTDVPLSNSRSLSAALGNVMKASAK